MWTNLISLLAFTGSFAAQDLIDASCNYSYREGESLWDFHQGALHARARILIWYIKAGEAASEVQTGRCDENNWKDYNISTSVLD